MEELKRRTAELDGHVRSLGDKIEANTLALNQVNDRQDRSERKGRVLAMVAVALLGGFLLLGWVAYQGYRTDRQVTSVVQGSLCPVFALVVGGYDPDSRPLNPDGSYEGSPRQAYIDNHLVMKDAYARLECRDTELVPPRSTQPPAGG